MRALAPALALLTGCALAPAVSPPSSPNQHAVAEPLRAILDSSPELRALTARAVEHKLQVVLGLVEEGPGGTRLRQVGFRAGSEYFYPASAVKLFGAVAALERLEELQRETGLDLTVDTGLVYHPLFEGEVLEATDPSNLQGGAVTLRHEIRKLFLVSDNESFNKLYELVGQDRLASALARVGLGDARIVHRLSEARSAEENRRAPRIDLVGEGFSYTLAERTSPPLPPAPAIPGLAIGTAYLAGDQRVEGAMDFAGKNRVALADLQRGLCKVVRPDLDCGGGGFALSEPHRALLLEAMSQFPRESANPRYDPAEYPDSTGKLLLEGLKRAAGENRFRIYAKYGQAYGFTTENAWVVDPESGRSFFLAATLYTNVDGVLNDDQYEYATVAAPFYTALGEALGRWFWASE